MPTVELTLSNTIRVDFRGKPIAPDNVEFICDFENARAQQVANDEKDAYGYSDPATCITCLILRLLGASACSARCARGIISPKLQGHNIW